MTNSMDNTFTDVFITENKKIFKFRYKWIIKDFSFVSNTVLRSSTFSSELLGIEDKWYIEINSNNSTSYVPINLKLASVKEGTTFLATYSVSILHVSDETSKHCTHFITTPITFSSQNNQIIISQLITRSALLHPSSGYLPDDNLTITCEIKIQVENSILKLQKNYIEKCQLKDNLEHLLENGMSADVTIKIGNATFKAIKGILAARSPVFCRMFSHSEMTENQNNEVIIEDIDENVFRELLHFIYTDETPKIEEFAEDLLAAADKYQLTRLKNLCEDGLIKKITVENAAELLVFADRHSAVQLKMKISQFIQRKLRDVVHTEGYKTHKKEHCELYAEVLEAIADKN